MGIFDGGSVGPNEGGVPAVKEIVTSQRNGEVVGYQWSKKLLEVPAVKGMVSLRNKNLEEHFTTLVMLRGCEPAPLKCYSVTVIKNIKVSFLKLSNQPKKLECVPA